jgi:hypothetical protein
VALTRPDLTVDWETDSSQRGQCPWVVAWQDLPFDAMVNRKFRVFGVVGRFPAELAIRGVGTNLFQCAGNEVVPASFGDDSAAKPVREQADPRERENNGRTLRKASIRRSAP